MATGLTGKTVCITGTLSDNRYVFERMIAAAGGTFTNSMSHRVDLLVLGMKPGKTKLQAVRRYGTRVITEEDLRVLAREIPDNVQVQMPPNQMPAQRKRMDLTDFFRE